MEFQIVIDCFEHNNEVIHFTKNNFTIEEIKHYILNIFHISDIKNSNDLLIKLFYEYENEFLNVDFLQQYNKYIPKNFFNYFLYSLVRKLSETFEVKKIYNCLNIDEKIELQYSIFLFNDEYLYKIIKSFSNFTDFYNNVFASKKFIIPKIIRILKIMNYQFPELKNIILQCLYLSEPEQKMNLYNMLIDYLKERHINDYSLIEKMNKLILPSSKIIIQFMYDDTDFIDVELYENCQFIPQRNEIYGSFYIHPC